MMHGFTLSRKIKLSFWAAFGIGMLSFFVGAIFAPDRTWANLLVATYYLLGMGLAGLVFVAFEYVTGASWSIAFRRVPEAMASTLTVASVAFLLVLFVSPALYPWFNETHEGGTAWFRDLWLNPAFFIVRAVFFLVVWIVFSRLIVGTSRLQDGDGDPAHTKRNIRLSAGFLVTFGITYWLAGFDWIMSLEPHWYSTIFGIYNFAGLFLGGLAMITLLVIWLEHAGPLSGVLNEEHLHDLGKLLFAFSSFWMYIWFCQYMLIWYANFPEETVYYMNRVGGFWGPLFLINLLLNWGVPFAVLLHVPAKRSRSMMVRVALILLVGRWVDLYLMVFPPIVGERPVMGLLEVGMMVGAAGLFFLVVFKKLGDARTVPTRDPFFQESLFYHN